MSQDLAHQLLSRLQAAPAGEIRDRLLADMRQTHQQLDLIYQKLQPFLPFLRPLMWIGRIVLDVLSMLAFVVSSLMIVLSLALGLAAAYFIAPDAIGAAAAPFHPLSPEQFLLTLLAAGALIGIAINYAVQNLVFGLHEISLDIRGKGLEPDTIRRRLEGCGFVGLPEDGDALCREITGLLNHPLPQFFLKDILKRNALGLLMQEFDEDSCFFFHAPTLSGAIQAANWEQAVQELEKKEWRSLFMRMQALGELNSYLSEKASVKKREGLMLSFDLQMVLMQLVPMANQFSYAFYDADRIQFTGPRHWVIRMEKAFRRYIANPSGVQIAA